jgi:TonB family protein
MNWVNYLIQINLYLAVFYAFYQLFLKDETFFNLNRAYLLSASFFSMMIPLARAEWVKSLFITEKVQTGWANVNVMVMQGFATPLAKDNSWAFGDYLTLIYLIGFAFLMIRLVYKLLKVKQLFKSENYTSEAFSFFGMIKINPTLPNQKEIEKHELIHAKQLHSADVIFFELLAIINWFNPVCYFYKKSIKHIHEFIADEAAVKLSDKKEYAILLFSSSFGVKPNQLTNNFFNQSLLKRRIKMLDKQKSRKAAILKYGLSAPLFLLAMILSSAKISENKTISKIVHAVEPQKTIAEIIVPKAVESLVSKPIKKEVKAINENDFSGLKKYLARTIRYPNSAKELKLSGKVAIDISVNGDGHIYEVLARTMKNNALGKESVKTIYAYKEALKAKEGIYTIFINYILKETNTNAENDTNDIGVIKNFIGEIIVTSYPQNITLMLNEVKKTDTIIDPKMVRPEPVFSNVEVLPSFPGGLQAFGKFLGENIKYPEEARKRGIEGRVYCTFVVEKDGSLTDIKIVRGIGYGCDEEAKRVLELSPKWNPGIQNGAAVRVSYTVPIFFQINKKLPPPPPPPSNFKLPPPPPPPIEINSTNKALFIIDGVEYKGDKNKLNEDLKKEDIQSVNVLKGDTAIKKYGQKGKDGVIEITTKKKN